MGLKAFWARRARRLLPALALMLIGVAFYARFVAQPSDLHQIRIDALATIAYVANWRFIFEHFSYWSLFTAPSPLQHTWSLAIEEQFYIVWPLVLALIARRARRGRARSMPRFVFITSTVLALASGTWAVILYRTAGSNRVYYGTDTRAAAILLGAALAAWLAWRGPVATGAGRTGVDGAGLLGVVGPGPGLGPTPRYLAASLPGRPVRLFPGRHRRHRRRHPVASGPAVEGLPTPAPGPSGHDQLRRLPLPLAHLSLARARHHVCRAGRCSPCRSPSPWPCPSSRSSPSSGRSGAALSAGPEPWPSFPPRPWSSWYRSWP